jgi:hypothetical protein
MTEEEAIQVTDESIAEVIAELEARKDLSSRERESQIDILLDHRASNIEMLLSISVEAALKKNSKILSERASQAKL